MPCTNKEAPFDRLVSVCDRYIEGTNDSVRHNSLRFEESRRRGGSPSPAGPSPCLLRALVLAKGHFLMTQSVNQTNTVEPSGGASLAPHAACTL